MKGFTPHTLGYIQTVIFGFLDQFQAENIAVKGKNIPKFGKFELTVINKTKRF